MSNSTFSKLEKKTKDDQVCLSKLRKVFQILSKYRSKTNEIRKKYFDKMKDIEDESPILQDIYTDMAESFLNIEEKGEEVKDNIDIKILPSITYIENLGKQLIEDLKYLNKNEEEMVLLKKEKEESKKNKFENISDLEQSIEEKQKDIEEKKDGYATNIIKYEKERIINIKLAMMHYFHNELIYEFKVMEELGMLYKKIYEKNPLDDFINFSNKFCDKDEIDLKEYGIKDDKKKNKSNSNLSPKKKDEKVKNNKKKKAEIEEEIF